MPLPPVKHDLTDPILRYAERHSTPEPEALAALRKDTWQHVLRPQMLSDPMQGRLLAMISRWMQPQRILELGTYTGYATMCLAEGLVPSGQIHTVEPNDELNAIQDRHWIAAGIRPQIHRYNAEAHDVLPRLAGGFDLVWIDADKARTADYVNACIPLTRTGGTLLIDNVLWWGKVMDGEESTDPDARRLHQLNEQLRDDPRVENIILPIRDGIHVLRKR